MKIIHIKYTIMSSANTTIMYNLSISYQGTDFKCQKKTFVRRRWTAWYRSYSSGNWKRGWTTISRLRSPWPMPPLKALFPACWIWQERAQGHICCVGTSATMGSESDAEKICLYATQIFGTKFEAGAVITESRLSADDFFAETRQNRRYMKLAMWQASFCWKKKHIVSLDSLLHI